MPQPNSGGPITSTPAVAGQTNYNAADAGGTSAAPWVKLPGGPCDLHSGQLTGADWASQPGLGTMQDKSGWVQT